MNPFQGAVALVTGGASGIGRALCLELALRGAEVVVTDLNAEGAEAVASEIAAAGGRATAQGLDVRDAEAVERAIGEAAAGGRLGYVFNNAGLAVLGEARDLTLDHWRKTVDVNLLGVVYGAHAAYRIFAAQGRGHVVNVSSLAGLAGFPLATPYATTKTGVVGLSRSLRVEGEDLGVKVTAVCPGFVRSAIFDAGTYVGSNRESALALIPVRFIPADVAAKKILDGVARNRAVIVFPFYARLMHWMARFTPGLLNALHRKTVRAFRRRNRRKE